MKGVKEEGNLLYNQYLGIRYKALGMRSWTVLGLNDRIINIALQF